MLSLIALLWGAAEPDYSRVPNPETLMRVSVYHAEFFAISDQPFKVQDHVFVQRDRLLSPERYQEIATMHRVAIEVCRPSRTGAAGQWIWPEMLQSVRARQCVAYVPQERQP